jgi:hypothetical protein
VNDNSFRHKNVDTIDSEMLIKKFTDVPLFVLNASMYLDGLFLYINCVHLSVYMSDYALRGLTNIVSTGSDAPEVLNYPVLGGISGSPCHKYRDLVL